MKVNTNLAAPVITPPNLVSDTDTKAISEQGTKQREEKGQQQQKTDDREEKTQAETASSGERQLLAEREAIFQNQQRFQLSIFEHSMRTDGFKLQRDTLNKEANGHMDSITKAISAGAQAVKGIRY